MKCQNIYLHLVPILSKKECVIALSAKNYYYALQFCVSIVLNL